MRAAALIVRRFRNLADAELELPSAGVALVGANGQGKTNLLEAIGYPVLYRSIRGALDREIGTFGGPGFHVSLTLDSGSLISVTWQAGDRGKQITVDGESQDRISPLLGRWLAVTFLPGDPALIGGVPPSGAAGWIGCCHWPFPAIFRGCSGIAVRWSGGTLR